MFEWWRRRSARQKGAEYIHNEAVDIQLNAASDTVEGDHTGDWRENILCGYHNAAGLLCGPIPQPGQYSPAH